MKYANNTVLTQKIMPLADAMSVYNAALRQKRSGEDNWMPEIIRTPPTAISAPAENEIGYPGFIGCMVSLAIAGREALKTGEALYSPSKTAVPTKTDMTGHNREFDVKKITPATLKSLFDAISVHGGVMSKPKKVDKVKPPLAPVKGTYDAKDYLHGGAPVRNASQS